MRARALHPPAGLANPGPIAAALWMDEEVEAGVHLDSVVTVVDALNVSRQLHEPRAEGTVNEAQLQIAYADLVLLNKVVSAGKEERGRRCMCLRQAGHMSVAVRIKVPVNGSDGACA